MYPLMYLPTYSLSAVMDVSSCDYIVINLTKTIMKCGECGSGFVVASALVFVGGGVRAKSGHEVEEESEEQEEGSCKWISGRKSSWPASKLCSHCVRLYWSSCERRVGMKWRRGKNSKKREVESGYRLARSTDREVNDVASVLTITGVRVRGN